MLLLAAVVLVDGASTLYAVSGKFALYEFLKVLSAFALALLLLALTPGEERQPGRWIAKILAGFAALAGLVSIDLLSTRMLSGPVLALLERFTPDYSSLRGVEAGVRMTSLFENPNVFAGVVGLGVLLSLGIVRSCEGKWERAVQTGVLYINALSFLLAFSMGATAAIAVAFVALLALERREERAGLFFLMAETLICSVLAAGVISATSFHRWDGIQPIPLVCVLLGAAALYLLDRFVGQPLASRLAGRNRLVTLLGLLGLSVTVAFVVTACLVTGPAVLEDGETLRRAAYPDAGEYALHVETDAPLSVTVESQNQRDTMMHTGAILYQGDVLEASFTVPEDSLVVYFSFFAPEGGKLHAASYEGASGFGAIPLDYPLLPGFVATRLQGLRANENAVQRLVFFSDGLKLASRSPVIGLGMGAFENGIKSVQSFYYETKYAHNHYIQMLVETGAVGLALFLLLLGGSAVAVLSAGRRGGERHPLVPALGAALVFMAGHAAVEVVFSTYPYLPMAFGVFALISLCCGRAPESVRSKRLRGIALLAICALMGAYTLLLVGNMRAKSVAAESSGPELMEKVMAMDRFEWADYALSHVVRAASPEADEETRRIADGYAQQLAELSSNTVPIYLARYYFQTDRPELGIAMLEKYVTYVSSDPHAWKNAFTMLELFERDEASYREGVLRIAGLLEAHNAASLEEIPLEESARAFIARMDQ